jgi:hypothetical protein
MHSSIKKASWVRDIADAEGLPRPRQSTEKDDGSFGKGPRDSPIIPKHPRAPYKSERRQPMQNKKNRAIRNIPAVETNFDIVRTIYHLSFHPWSVATEPKAADGLVVSHFFASFGGSRA